MRMEDGVRMKGRMQLGICHPFGGLAIKGVFTSIQIYADEACNTEISSIALNRENYCTSTTQHRFTTATSHIPLTARRNGV
jgi:hypothetical protein